MSDKVRVLFDVPEHLKPRKLYEPVYVTVEEYVYLKISERDHTSTMADYVSQKYLKNAPLSPDDVSMTKAVGNSMEIYDIDELIEEHREGVILEKIHGPLNTAPSEFYGYEIETKPQPESTQTYSESNDSISRQVSSATNAPNEEKKKSAVKGRLLGGCLTVIVIFILLFLFIFG